MGSNNWERSRIMRRIRNLEISIENSQEKKKMLEDILNRKCPIGKPKGGKK